MTIEQTKDTIAIMQAYVDGKDIEILCDDGEWAPLPAPDWNWQASNYRIAPPKPREYWISKEASPQVSYSKPFFYPELWIHVREVLP